MQQIVDFCSTGRAGTRWLRLASVALLAAASAAGAAPPITEDAELIGLVSPLPPAGSNGGAAVSVSNGTAIVGAPAQNSAYVYTYDGGTNTWTYQTTLTAGVTGDNFGASVSISGDNVAIGAPGTSSNAGAVYIFNGGGASWSQTAMLTESGAASGNKFGYAAAMDGLRLVIGAPYESFPGKSAVGTAYLYSSDGANWNLNTSINLPPGQRHANAHIGAAVALSGAQLLVGAPDDTKGSHALAGNVYDFVCNGTNCVRAQRLSPGPINNAHLGSSLAILNNTALVGAKGDGATLGHVYVFKLAGNTWSLNQTLNGAAAGDLFGSSVALGGQQAVVGASGTASGGTAYLYGISGGSYAQLDQLSGSNTAAGDKFGTSITLGGGEAVIGAPFATNPTATNSQDGGAYAYKTAKTSITAISNVDPGSSVTNESYTVYVQVSNGDSGAAVPSGSVSVAEDIDSTATCTATLDASGAGNCSMISASLGQSAHNIEATYSGDGIFGNSSALQPYEVDPADTTTAITLQSANPSQVNQNVTFTVSVTPAFTGPATPTGAVTITDGTNTLCTIADISTSQSCGPYAFAAPGTTGLVVSYAGDQNFNGSSDSSSSHETDAADTTTSVVAAPEPSVVGQQVTFTVTVTPAFGGTPTGSVTVSDTSSNVLCTVADVAVDPTCTHTFGAAGSTDVVAAYAGDSNFNASDSSAVPYTHVTNAADTTVSVTPDHNPSFTGGLVTFTIGVTANAPGAGTPTGSVAINDSGNNTICIVADVTVPNASCSHTFAPSGSYNLTAFYSPADGNFNASSLPFTQVVNDAPTHLAFRGTIADVQQGDRLAGLTVGVIDNNTGNPDLADNSTQVTLTLNTFVCAATITIGPVTVTNGVADFGGLGPRFYTLAANYMLTASSSTGLPTVDSNMFNVVTGNLIFSDGFESCRP